jgi:gingipain R
MILNKIYLKIILVMLVSTLLISTAAPLTATTPMQQSTSFTLSIDLINYNYNTIQTPLGSFATIEIEKNGYTITEGQPQLPVLRYYIEVPYGANPQISIQSDSWTTTTLSALNLPAEILPVQPSQQKDTTTTPTFVYDDEIYTQSSPLQTTITTFSTIGILRGRQVALLEINPIQYTPATGHLSLLNSIEVTITFPGADIEQTQQITNRYTTNTFDQLFQNLFSNYGMIQPPTSPLGRQEGYLIIVYDNFFDEIQPLASWKQTKGFDVTVTKTSDIPGSATKENIHNYIQDAYDNWAIPPAYVLLVGDEPQLPTYIGSESYTAADLYFVTVDGSDYFPDIFIGRFPGSEDSHITAMVEKTVFYEQGVFENLDWVKKAAFMASVDNYQISEGTHNYVIDNYLVPNGYISDKLYQVTYGATTQDVRDSLNDGRSLAIYSGHGSETSWADGPPFSQNDVNNLINEDMYPLVCSHACVTGKFTVNECFGETWVRAPNKAAVIFWGSSANTYWDEDDVLEKEVFGAWWNDGLEWIGGMTDMGLYYLYQHYGGGGLTEYYFECYNIFGDPSLVIWSDDPDPNIPPEQPNPPDGPEVGVCNRPSTFTASTTDPEGYDIYYKFSWGDNTTSGWIGPYPTGGTGTEDHTWIDPGIYEVRVKAMDINGTESSWSDPSLIEIVDGPLLDVGLINGGFFRIKSVIRNHGATEAENVEWRISLDGGTILMGKESTGTIPTIASDGVVEVQSGMIFGFGSTRVTVHAEINEGADFRDQGATVFLFYVHIKPGGG